ncbi:hypothetical protein HY031_00185 [Candidatus Gottesmanbacteria bacterium]|nr:hypothetical protein [Candidatus Gottesmanbacteria bacterium]
MKRDKRSVLEKRVEKNFRELKRRTEIRDRYGVFTQKMLENLFDKKLEEKLDPLHQKFDKLFEKIDWFAGKYTKLEEEQKLLSGRVSKQSDNLEIVNEKLGITL